MSKSFTIHDLPADERPRERLVKFGEQALSAQELLQVILGRGIAGESIKAVFEIGRRLSTQAPTYKSKELTDPEKVYRLIKSKLKDYHKEHFYIIVLNSRNHSIVHPREVFAEAIKNKAASVIFVHNHPSGDPEPSEDDLTITKRLVEVGKIMGIEIIDHIIVTENGFLSFKDKKLI